LLSGATSFPFAHRNLQDASQNFLARASRLIPAGVNSPVRAWRAVGGEPPFIVRGNGAEIWDADGNVFLDLVGAWGPLIAGHARQEVVEAVSQAALRGTGFGAPTPVEVELAELIAQAFASIEKVRLVTSGTEAVMTALRIARAATGRSRIIKANGCYHGHHDSMLVRAGSGLATFGVPDSAGVPEQISALTTVVEYNDLAGLDNALTTGPPTAAVIIEPVAANMGVVPPAPGYLAGVVESAHRAGALVIFDEVITGFRLARGGAQERFAVAADLTCLGKIIGGGLPVAAVGGRAPLMDLLAPLGPVYQAGTLSGNPIACSAGVATIKLLTPAAYESLEVRGAELETGIQRAIARTGARAVVQRVGSLLTLFFGVESVRDFRRAQACDLEGFARFFRRMFERGIYLPPSQFEAWFLSLAHGGQEISRIVTAVDGALAEIGAGK
jgi:glutamate-1-semialdehyde 2,1-aminomutase